MSKRFICFVAGAVVLFNGAVSAQIHLSPGIVAGLSSFSQKEVWGAYSVVHDRKTGIVAGGILDISLFNLLSIEPGLAYSMRGSKMDQDLSSVGGGIVHTTLSFNYLAIPVHIKIKYPLPMVKLYALGGANVGLLLSAKGKDEMDGSPAVETDVKDSLSTTDFGIDFGGGVELSLPKITPFIEFVYYMGMLDIEKKPYVTDKSSGIEIKAGLKFKM
jgi:hypothetical protein